MHQGAITYTIRMLSPQTHLYDVAMDITGLTGTATEFILPSWSPGSYLIRDYARHIQEFSATSGATPLVWYKVAKDAWRVEHPGRSEVHLAYRVYANELTVRTSHLDGTHGYFNGTTVFFFVPHRMREPVTLHVDVPHGWHVSTGLEYSTHHDQEDSVRWSFRAEDYDELVDCPVECGTHRLFSFEVDGIEHRLALWGHGNEQPAQLVQDTKRIVETYRTLFGGLPYRHYTFLLHLANSWGGLEHRNSVTNLVDRWSFFPEESYERVLDLQSHEFFHVWNVKRIRPAPLGPFDYRRENHTRQMWAMEGVTSYYDRLMLVRAGLMKPHRYLSLLADDILKIQSTPGRALQSLEDGSFDAWIKLYRPDEHSSNSGISYYLKGGMVALLLDLEIRHRTDGAHSLDDVLRYLFATYPISGPGIPEERGYLDAIEAVAGRANGAYETLFRQMIAGTGELAYEQAFEAVGITLTWGYSATPRTGEKPAWLGMTCRQEHGHTFVQSVRSDGPAFHTGITANDELLALDGYRVTSTTLSARLLEYEPGDSVTLSLFRRDELVHQPVTLAPAPFDTLSLDMLTPPDQRQQRLYREWLWLPATRAS